MPTKPRPASAKPAKPSPRGPSSPPGPRPDGGLPSSSFRDKVVVVTGGGQGIGRALCLAFARKGAEVVIAESDARAGRECEALVRDRGGSARFVRVDVSRESDVKAMARAAARIRGGIDVLINNAGISASGDPLESPTSLWHRVLGANLTGAFLCARECARHMGGAGARRRSRGTGARAGGCIVNIASIRAAMSEPGWEAYAASKGGMLSLTHALAVSLGPRGIRVNAVSPGWIEVSEWKRSGVARPPELRPVDHDQHPAGRVGRPEDVAAA